MPTATHPPAGAEFASVSEVLSDLEPGVSAMAYLRSVEPAELDPSERVLVLQAWERQQAWVMAQTQLALLAVAGPEPTPANGAEEAQWAQDDWSRDEVAAALGLSGQAAGKRIHVARVLNRCLPATAAYLNAGAISWRHVLALVDECAGLPDAAISTVEANVIERAPAQAVPQFTRSVRRAVISCATVHAELAHAVAKTKRGVWLHAEPDGMASLTAFLPAAQARAAYGIIDQTAHATPATIDTDGRKPGFDERRADAFLALLADNVAANIAGNGRLAVGHTDKARARKAKRARNRVAKTPPVRRRSRAAGTSRVAGQSRVAGTSRTGAATALAGKLLGTTGTPAGNVLGAFAGCRGDTAADTPRARVNVEMQVVIDAATLLGRADNPGELVGYGPITAGVARELAGDATWRRLVTDPATGYLLDFGRRVYRAPDALANYVRARDRFCRFPGCGRAAVYCDIDHDHPWSKGGETSARNCSCLCRRHHRLKTHGGWQRQLHKSGACTWISPTGRRYELAPPTQFDTG